MFLLEQSNKFKWIPASPHIEMTKLSQYLDSVNLKGFHLCSFFVQSYTWNMIVKTADGCNEQLTEGKIKREIQICWFFFCCEQHCDNHSTHALMKRTICPSFGGS